MTLATYKLILISLNARLHEGQTNYADRGGTSQTVPWTALGVSHFMISIYSQSYHDETTEQIIVVCLRKQRAEVGLVTHQQQV